MKFEKFKKRFYSFADLCNGYNERDSVPFEIWLANELKIEIPYFEENGDPDLDKLFDVLEKETSGKLFEMVPLFSPPRPFPICSASDYLLKEIQNA